ncbi:MAG: XdhC family protein, partial [Acidimicrobiales bacterium]
MRDLLDAFEGWRAGGRRAALARLVDVSGQFPGRVGAALAVSEDGEVAGSLDHPGIEDAVVEAAGDLLAQAVGAPAASRILMWDGRAVLLGRADWSVLAPLVDAVRGGRDVALAVQTGGPGTGAALLVGGHGRLAGSLGHDRLDAVASADALGALALGRTTTHHYGPHGERHGRE